MIDLAKDESNFDRAKLAARDVPHSVLEVARRTNTPVVIFRNGKVEHVSPDAFQQQPDGSFSIRELLIDEPPCS